MRQLIGLIFNWDKGELFSKVFVVIDVDGRNAWEIL